MDLQLDGKRALVTGGSKGIGKAVARALAAEGCDVAIAARTAATLEATAAELAAATGRRIVPVVMDTGSDESVGHGVAAATGALGGIDILVNSAAQPMGQAAPPRLADITDELFWNDVNVKVMGYVRCARAVAPQMTDRGWGRIVNISGLGARTVGSAIGSARNAAVAAMTKNLADELGPQGVNVTVVHPGLTRTEATPGVVAARALAAGTDEATIEAQLARALDLRLEDPDLAYLSEGTPEFGAYIGDMLWAQDYARANRDQMMDRALAEITAFLGFGRETRRVNCHHNFTQRETHQGRELWITRKGAIKAGVGDLGVIPGSMGTRSAYKDIDRVMADQTDLVEVLHTLHQILNYKGV